MKNLFFLLVLLFIAPTVASANYIYNADVDNDNPCCIKILIWSNTSSTAPFTAVVDGVTYDQNSPEWNGRYILHCVNTNGTYTVTINVPGWGSPYTNDVVVDGCVENECCNFTMGDPTYATLPPPFDPCLVILSVSGTSGITGCGITTSWDIDGDGITDGTGSTFHATFTTTGPHTVCVTRSSTTSPDCPAITKCMVVTAPGCGIDEKCCNFTMGTPVFMVAPWDPCLVRLSVSGTSFITGCGITTSWDIDGDGVSDGTGSSLITTFNGPGPHTVCVTKSSTTSPGCPTITKCLTVNLPNCPQGMITSGPSGGRNSKNNTITNDEWETAMQAATESALELFPNPATNELNIKLPNDATSTIESIQVINVNGQIVKTENGISTSLLSIDISTLASGVYMVRAINKDGMTQTTKQFVKNK